MKKVYLLVIPTALAIAVAVNSVYWFLPYIWDAIGLGLAGAVVAVYLLTTMNKAKVRPYLAALIVVALLAAGGLRLIAPSLARSEVESIARSYLSGYYSSDRSRENVTSAEYQGRGTWKVNYFRSQGSMSQGWSYIEFDERTGKFGGPNRPTFSSATPTRTATPTAQPTPGKTWQEIRAERLGGQAVPTPTTTARKKTYEELKAERMAQPIPTPTPTPSSVTVTVRSYEFSPSEIRVPIGSTVTWFNEDSTSHYILTGLSSPASLVSGEIRIGQSWKYTFVQRGTYRYYCNLHPGVLQGSVIVY